MESQHINYLNRSGIKFDMSTMLQQQSTNQSSRKDIDIADLEKEKREIIYTYPKNIIDKVTSPKNGIEYHLNPYQGCGNGCKYCYARKSHELFGYNEGLDFERKIIVKKNTIELLETTLSQKNWKPKPILLSSNTDCYQAIEIETELTRHILKTCLKYKHPISVMTKNTLISRDLDVLTELAAYNLVHVMISVNSYDETMRQLLEPNSSTTKNRMIVLETLSKQNIPCGVMLAPIIPGINHHEIPDILEEAASLGAKTASIDILRLQGSFEKAFKDLLFKKFPDKADHIWNQIIDCQHGKIKDARKSVRIKDEVKLSEYILQLFQNTKEKFKLNQSKFVFNTVSFNYKAGNNQLSLF